MTLLRALSKLARLNTRLTPPAIPPQTRFLHDPWQPHGFVGAALSSNVIHFTKVGGRVDQVASGGWTWLFRPGVQMGGATAAQSLSRCTHHCHARTADSSPLISLACTWWLSVH